MTLLSTGNLSMQFGGLTAVSDFNLTLNAGEIVALIGPNGAGKTTAFNMITGVYKPTKGKIMFKDQPIVNLRPDRITKLGIARTFQNIRLFKDLSVLDNVLIANHLHVKSNFLDATFKLSPKYWREEKAMQERSRALLEEVGLLELAEEKAGSLPYGKQRRLEIARALATKPEVLMLDEPAAGMNPTETEELGQFVQQIQKEYSLSIFMIEHHMEMVMGISHRIYVFDHGVTIAQGSPYEVQNDPKVIEAYLGVADEDA